MLVPLVRECKLEHSPCEDTFLLINNVRDNGWSVFSLLREELKGLNVTLKQPNVVLIRGELINGKLVPAIIELASLYCDHCLKVGRLNRFIDVLHVHLHYVDTESEAHELGRVPIGLHLSLRATGKSEFALVFCTVLKDYHDALHVDHELFRGKLQACHVIALKEGQKELIEAFLAVPWHDEAFKILFFRVRALLGWNLDQISLFFADAHSHAWSRQLAVFVLE